MGKFIKTTIDEFLNEEQKHSEKYYTTSHPMSISDFIELEVEERENYEMEDVDEWIEKYNITDDTELLWVATKPYIAARYQMETDDWENCKEIYEKKPEEYNVIVIDSNDGELILESEDGDDGYLMVLNNVDKYNF